MTSNDKLFMRVAFELALNSKCVSKQVGCVITRNDRIVSSGINGTPKGFPVNCCDIFDGDFCREDHHKWSNEHELHGEQNALAGCIENGIDLTDATVYVTLQPCSSCVKEMIATRKIKRIVYAIEYDKGSKTALDTARQSGIIVEQLNGEE